MRRLFVGLLALAVGVESAQAQDSTPGHDVSRAGWLAGCWEMRAGPRVMHEQWMAPAAGAMFGMSRTIVGDSLRDWEFVILGPSAAGLAYQVNPAQQDGASFPATFMSDTLLVFENPSHDFPQRIIYRRRGADSVHARIEGQMNGEQRSMDFPFRRVSCGAST